MQSGDAAHLLLLEHNGYLRYELSNEPFDTWEEYERWTVANRDDGETWSVNVLTIPLEE